MSEVCEQLRGQAGNELCADCGSQDPQWASLNLGVLICMNCAGWHRQMGVHISRVKSLGLDTWKPEEIRRVLEAGGNAAVNAVYEANLSPEEKRKLASIDRINLFIQDKYANKTFHSELSHASLAHTKGGNGAGRDFVTFKQDEESSETLYARLVQMYSPNLAKATLDPSLWN